MSSSQTFKLFQLVYKSRKHILEMLEDSYDIPQNVNMQVLERATSQLDLAINDIYTAIFESDNY